MKDKMKKVRQEKSQRIILVLTTILFIALFQKSILVRAAEDSGYIFPDSADRYMSTGELEGLTLQIINYGKNEIYARHGRQFRSQELQEYFDEQEWCKPLLISCEAAFGYDILGGGIRLREDSL